MLPNGRRNAHVVMAAHILSITHILSIRLDQVRNMKTLGEALEVFTKEEVVSFKWDKEVNADTGALNNHAAQTFAVVFPPRVRTVTFFVCFFGRSASCETFLF